MGQTTRIQRSSVMNGNCCFVVDWNLPAYISTNSILVKIMGPVKMTHLMASNGNFWSSFGSILRLQIGMMEPFWRNRFPNAMKSDACWHSCIYVGITLRRPNLTIDCSDLLA